MVNCVSQIIKQASSAKKKEKNVFINLNIATDTDCF